MDEIINTGLLKEDSLSARIYFSLLAEPKTQSQLSREIYEGKVQLDNISKNIKDLMDSGYVEKLGRFSGKGQNYNQIYYQSTLKPLLEYITNKVKWRKKTSKSSKKENISSNDINFLKVLFNSNWFKRFYSQEYLNSDLEASGKSNKRYCSCPIRLLARLIEEFFVITEMFGNHNFLLTKENEKIIDFDKFILSNQQIISDAKKKLIKKVVNNAKENLGNYPKTNSTIDFYFKDFGVLYLPYNLSKKLSSIGRVPLTVAIAFDNALKYNHL